MFSLISGAVVVGSLASVVFGIEWKCDAAENDVDLMSAEVTVAEDMLKRASALLAGIVKTREDTWDNAPLENEYFRNLYDVDRRAEGFDFNWAGDIQEYFDGFAKILDPTSDTIFTCVDDVDDTSGVEYTAKSDTEHTINFGKQWLTFPSSATLLDGCHGKQGVPTFNYLTATQNGKAQMIINALVKKTKFRSEYVRISDEQITVEGFPVDLATDMPDAVALADQSLKVTAEKSTCPDDATSKGKAHPYRCSLWNTPTHGYFAQAIYWTDKDKCNRKLALSNCPGQKVYSGTKQNKQNCQKDCQMGKCSEVMKDGMDLSGTVPIKIQTGNWQCGNCPGLG